MSYVAAGYSVVFAGLGAYTVWILRRRRTLGRALTVRRRDR
jgi:CcmD family protein